MRDHTTQEIMTRLPEAFLPEKAAGVEAVVQCQFTGEDGGDWVITIKNSQCTTKPGQAANPKLTLRVSAQDFHDLITGKLNGMQAFMLGKIKVTGDVGLGMRLTSLFQQP
jgi:putative sterol carrier protein